MQLLFLASTLQYASAANDESQQPVVNLNNGSYYGVYNPRYSEDIFLGIPYAQPPLGDLRFRLPQSLNTTWTGQKNATSYSYECIGYGSDDWVLGNPVSEDCLTVNVIRPHGLVAGSNLPVAVWIHGGGFFNGGSLDQRYNLSFIVQESISMRSPIIAVSLNYRLAAWGFMSGQEVADAGITNLGLRDQRLALHWIQENIQEFGGDPGKVTIWGESAGAHSVGAHLVAYGGRDDKLFRGAISQSGAPAPYTTLPTISTWQPIYNAVVNATNCTSSVDTLGCLRTVPSDTLSAIFNSSITGDAVYLPSVDGDILRESGTKQLRKGQFVKIPYLNGANFDEGGQFGVKGINTTEQFLALVESAGPDNATSATIAALYPDIPGIGIPATLEGRPPVSLAEYGHQWKRSAAYEGDLWMHAGRRLTSQSWAAHNVSTWSYHFNVLANGVSLLNGASHFQEVAFVMNNVQGLGYNTVVALNPFANTPATFPRLAKIMSRMWISFISELDPNYNRGKIVKNLS